MIKIKHPNISQIVDKHYNACKNYIEPRLNFIIDLFDAIGNKNYKTLSNTVSKSYKLQDVSIMSLINPVLKSRKKYKKKKYNVTINEIESALTTKNNHIIDLKKISISKAKELYSLFSNLKEDMEGIIKGDPDSIYDFAKSDVFNLQKNEIAKKIIEKIFSYEKLTSKDGLKLSDTKNWSSYELTKELDISVCPYCNRNWIMTVTEGKKKKKVVNPQLDHFFSKSDFPILRLSFHNLIPSCETCNARLKKAIEFNKDENLHPYMEEYGEHAKFKSLPLSEASSKGMDTNFKVDLKFDRSISDKLEKKIANNHLVFEIETIYKKHGDIIAELYRKSHISSKSYLNTLKDTYESWNISHEELYRLAFGNYFNEEDFKKRPLAKLTKDIAEDIGLI